MTSGDGLQWTQIASPTTAWLHGVAFSGNGIVLVGDAGIVEIAGTYSISGKVTQNSAPLVGVGGVTITAHDTINLDDTVAVTAADGTYSVTGIGNSTYDVTPTFAPNVFNPIASTGIVILNANVTGVNFSMIAVHTLSGAVVFPGTVTPPYPVITINGTNASFPAPFLATTAPADGSYSGNLPAIGTWIITPAPTGTWVFNPSSASLPMTSDTVLNFQALAEADITGTLNVPCDNGNPITVTATAPGGFSFSVVVPSPYGAYTLPVAQNKTYTVTASGTGYDFNPLSTTVVVGAVAVPGINFTATAFWNISGTCYYSTDLGTTWLPLAGATVTAAPLSSTATTDAGGNYTLTHIPTGAAITVSATKAGYILVSGPIPGVMGCGNVAGIDFGFYPAYNVSGRILYNGTTAGVPGVTVTAIGVGGPYTATTAADGTYTLLNVYSPAAITVTPALAGFTFNPAMSLVLVVGTMTGIDFTATGIAADPGERGGIDRAIR